MTDAATKRLLVCADDYAYTQQTSAAIISLIEEGAINATSCVVESQTWASDGEVLRQTAASRPHVAVGLHLNLTERIGSQQAIFSQARLAFDRSETLINQIYERFSAQWALFVSVIGFQPHFIDGHQHAHLPFASRVALFRLIEAVGFRGWVRQCRTSSQRFSAKRIVLDPLTDAFRAHAQRHLVQLNPGFGGLRRFALNEDVIAQWIEDLTAMRGGGVLMVHAGAEAPGDPIGHCRRQEAAALPWVTEKVDQHGFSMQFDAQAPW